MHVMMVSVSAVIAPAVMAAVMDHHNFLPARMMHVAVSMAVALDHDGLRFGCADCNRSSESDCSDGGRSDEKRFHDVSSVIIRVVQSRDGSSIKALPTGNGRKRSLGKKA